MKSLASALKGAASRVVDELVGGRARRRQLLVGQRAAVGRDVEEHAGQLHRARLRGVVAAVVVGIAADRFRSSAAAASSCGSPSRSAATPSAPARPCSRDTSTPHIQACMPPIELPITRRRWRMPRPSLTQPVVRLDHVVVVVFREFGAQAVGRLARFAVADRIRNDDEMLGRIERLARAEQLAAECRA